MWSFEIPTEDYNDPNFIRKPIFVKVEAPTEKNHENYTESFLREAKSELASGSLRYDYGSRLDTFCKQLQRGEVSINKPMTVKQFFFND